MLQLNMKLINQTMINCNYNINTSFKSDKDVVKKLDINIETEIAKDPQNNQMGITTTLSLFKGENAAAYPFQLSLSFLSLYEISEETLKEECDEELVKITFDNLYPYLRTCVSSVTSLGGFSPLTLPKININDYHIDKE